MNILLALALSISFMVAYEIFSNLGTPNAFTDGPVMIVLVLVPFVGIMGGLSSRRR